MTETASATATQRTESPTQLLWTGGWDSSFRLMQLLLVERRPVQPIYIINLDRRSMPQEMRTMTSMRRQLRARLDDPELMLPTQMLLQQEVPPRPDLAAVTAAIREKTHVGTQYAIFSGIAEVMGWEGVEICMQAHEGGVVSDLHRLVFAEEVGGRLTDAPEARIFRHWSFPVLHITKTEMAAIAREHGFYDLLVQRWFCHQPVMGKACGRCIPCQRANREGVDFASPAVVTAARTSRKAISWARRLARR